MLVVVGRVISFFFLTFSTKFLLLRLNCCYNLSAIEMASFRRYEWDFIGLFLVVWVTPVGICDDLFHSSWGACPVSRNGTAL